jgi:DinB family protein
MRYMMLPQGDREVVMSGLLAMPDVLEASFGALSADVAMQPGPGGVLSPVEICWHLADLEAEGYAVRIRRLLGEEAPRLLDFDGGAIAKERNYRALPLSEGLEAFRAARRANVEALRRLTDDEWQRSGTQDGVGPVALCDIPSMMAEHDAGHREEVAAWVASRS